MKRRIPDARVPRARTRRLLRLALPRTLDRRGGLRPATLAAAAGVDPRELPMLAPMPAAEVRALPLSDPATGMAMLDGRLYITTLSEEGVAQLHTFRDGALVSSVAYTPLSDAGAVREIVQFNVYSDPTDPLGGEYRHMGIIFPDGVFFPLGTDTPTLECPEQTDGRPLPRLSHITVHLSRLFGAAGDRLYASAYNDPQNWNVDTAGDIGAANAWATTVQSNTEASGDFSALTVFGGQVHAFKEGFCHVLSGTKNPFRVGDLFSVGAAAPRSLAEVGGRLYFADREQVYRYNGDTPVAIGAPLGGADLSGALGCAGSGLYYLYLPSLDEMLVLSTDTGAWSSLGRVCGEGAVGRHITCGEDGPLLLDSQNRLHRIGGAGTLAFFCTLAPLTEEGEGTARLCRLLLSVEGEAGARVCAYYTDLSGRRTPLFDMTLPGAGLHRARSRMFTPADRGGYLSLSGEGRVRVEEISLLAEEQK